MLLQTHPTQRDPVEKVEARPTHSPLLVAHLYTGTSFTGTGIQEEQGWRWLVRSRQAYALAEGLRLPAQEAAVGRGLRGLRYRAPTEECSRAVNPRNRNALL